MGGDRPAGAMHGGTYFTPYCARFHELARLHDPFINLHSLGRAADAEKFIYSGGTAGGGGETNRDKQRVKGRKREGIAGRRPANANARQTGAGSTVRQTRWRWRNTTTSSCSAYLRSLITVCCSSFRILHALITSTSSLYYSTEIVVISAQCIHYQSTLPETVSVAHGTYTVCDTINTTHHLKQN